MQAVVTEYLVRHADLIFNDKLPADYSITTTVLSHKASCSASGRPKSLAISSPIRLMSLEEAKDRLKQDDRKYIEVGGGPSSLPPKYHTVIDLPSRRSALKNKRSPIGWRQFFSRNRSFSKATARKITNPIEITVMTKSMPMAGPQGIQTNWAGRLRPVKSVESLVSSPMYITSGASNGTGEHSDHHTLDHESVLEDVESNLSKSSPATPVMTDVDVLFHAAPHHEPPTDSGRGIQNPKTHNRSISHDSYFEFGEFRNSNRVYIDETLEEETLSQSSKLSLEISSGGESPTRKNMYAKDSTKGSKSSGRGGGMMSPMTPPPSAASLVVPTAAAMMSESVTSTSSDDVVSEHYATPKSPLLPSKWRDSEVQTSHTKLYDVGVCTQEDMDQCTTVSTGNGVVSSSTTTSFASSGQRTATTTTSCGVTRDSSAQSLISQSSSGGENIYELDRNSSIDESSVDSTPCEPYAMTNIIYSPLIDDLSSPTSSGGDRFKSSMDPFRVSSDSVASTTNNTPGSRLYICPLYEAGVSTMESISSAVSVGTEVTDVSSTMSVSPRTNAPRNNQYENVSLINTHKPHNLEVFLCSSSQSLNTPVSSQEEQQQQSVGHVYANQQFYENQPPPVPAIRKSKSEGAVMMTNLNSNAHKQSSPQPQNQQISPSAPVAVTNVLVEHEQPIYEKEYYENISEIEVEPVKTQLPPAMNNDDNVSRRLSSHRESNIYEDIDTDDDDELNTGNKYETVEFEKGVMRSRPSAIYNDDSDDEYEKVQENPVVIHHHYAEIEERMETNSVSPDSQEHTSTTTVVIGASSPEENEIEKVEEEETSGATSTIPIAGESVESSPSHSHTEDMVTYLEVQTPHLNLRTNSLDDQEEISQQSSHVSGGSKLDKTNSRDSSDTPDNSPGDEGEIRHIDSPINSPATSSPPAVNNPLYGMPAEQQVESQVTPLAESKDNLEVQSDDGEEEEMSVNESLSISISMEESPKSKPSIDVRASDHGINMKMVSRCNSAPLAVGVHEFTVALDRSLDERDVNGITGDNSSGDDDVFYKSKAPATRSNSSALEIQPKDDVEKRFGEKILLCKRLSEPSLLFSNQNINNSSCMMMAALTSQKTDSSNNNTGGSTNPAGGGASPAAWKIADAKRLANRKQSVKELLSKFETRDSNSSPSPVHSPPSSLPPTGFTSNNKDSMTLTSGGRSPSTNSIGGSTNGGISVGTNGRHQHHRFSTGDILMSQSVSAVENLNCISGGSFPGVQSTNSLIVRSDTFPELSRDDSASKENTLHGAFSAERNDDDQGMSPS